MRFIKLIIISVIILFGIATLISLLLPSRVLVSRAIDITADKQVIQGNAINIKNWKHWLQIDSSHQLVYNGETKSLSLNDNLIKETNLTDTSVVTIWTKTNSKDSIENTIKILQLQPTQSTVQWQMVQHVKWYPWEKFASMLNDKMLGDFMEKNLKELKKVSEAY